MPTGDGNSSSSASTDPAWTTCVRGEAFAAVRRKRRYAVQARTIRMRIPAPRQKLVRAALNRRERLRLHWEALRRPAPLHALVGELRAGTDASLETYAELVTAWGNEHYSASPEF